MVPFISPQSCVATLDTLQIWISSITGDHVDEHHVIVMGKPQQHPRSETLAAANLTRQQARSVNERL